MSANNSDVLQSTPPIQYESLSTQQRLTLHEAALMFSYQLRLLNWWHFLLMAFGFCGCGLLAWIQLHFGGTQGLSHAIGLSQFMIEPGAGLFAGIFASSLIVGDPLREVLITTQTGISKITIWRYQLVFFILLCYSTTYLIWSLDNGIAYMKHQNLLVLLMLWLAPVSIMSMLGLLGSLATRNASLGLVIAAIPLASSLFLYDVFAPNQAIHPFFISYTYSGGQDAPDWWINRLALLGVALAFATINWCLLRREESLLDPGQ
jgi:hypothetical protein